MKVDEVRPGESPRVYVEVEEIEPYLEKAKQLGGGVAVPKTEIPRPSAGSRTLRTRMATWLGFTRRVASC